MLSYSVWVEVSWVRGFQINLISWQYDLGDRISRRQRENTSSMLSEKVSKTSERG